MIDSNKRINIIFIILSTIILKMTRTGKFSRGVSN